MLKRTFGAWGIGAVCGGQLIVAAAWAASPSADLQVLWKTELPKTTEASSELPAQTKTEGNEDPLVWVTVRDRFLWKSETQSCASVLLAAREIWEKRGKVYDSRKPRLDDGWAPWTERDREDVEGCTRFPCKVKLDAGEVGLLKAKAETARLAGYFDLVGQRVRTAQKQGIRLAYEFPGPIVDPFKIFAASGMGQNGGPGSSAQTVLARILDLKTDRMRPVRQILEVQSVQRDKRIQGVLRDLYSDHYFDSWGEAWRVECLPDQKQISVAQALVLEVDLLKETDWISRFSYGSIRRAVRDEGWKYLQRQSSALGVRLGQSTAR